MADMADVDIIDKTATFGQGDYEFAPVMVFLSATVSFHLKKKRFAENPVWAVISIHLFFQPLDFLHFASFVMSRRRIRRRSFRYLQLL